MSRKITQEEFLNQFYRNYPNQKIEIVEYTAISKPAKIKCCNCGKIQQKRVARNFINSFSCCIKEEETKLMKIQKQLKDSLDFTFIKQKDKDHVIIKHEKCGNEFVRAIPSVMNNVESCPYCNTQSTKNQLSIEQAQKQIDELFDSIKVIEYGGQNNRNKYRCLKCGMIFQQKQICLLQSRGCPKCDRWKSKGEVMMKKILEEKNILFEEQVSVKELPLQHFDFVIYDIRDNIVGIIEVNGQQYYFNRSVFDNLEVQQERDNRKRQWCKERNIPLYEIQYFKGQFKNLDILPF